MGETKWRYELTNVEKSVNELWLRVKYQSIPDNTFLAREIGGVHNLCALHILL